jgi:hypothetical protein
MVQGFEASFCWWSEILGIPAVYFGVSPHIGGNLEKVDLSRIVRKVEDFLGANITVVEAGIDDVVGSWRSTFRLKGKGEGFYI